MFSHSLLLMASIATTLQPTASASQAPSDGNAIVVQGTRTRDQEIRAFVKALTKAPIWGQLARYDRTICPASVGLSEQQNRLVEERMRRVVNAVGLENGKAGCTANALVIVVGDKDEFMAALRKQQPRYFRTPIDTRVRVANDPGPVVAWHVEGLLDANGNRATVVQGEAGNKYYSIESTDSSRIKPQARPNFLLGVLVVDVDALAGLTTTQLADYAAMRLLGRTDPARLAKFSRDSILKVIDAPMESDVPITLTQWDLAFLKSLYATDPLTFALNQRAAMSKKIARELDRAEGSKSR